MIVVGVQSRVVVEVLLHMDDIRVVFGKQLANASRVVRLVTRNIVSVQKGREPSNVQSQDVERARGRSRQGGGQEAEKPEGRCRGDHLLSEAACRDAWLLLLLQGDQDVLLYNAPAFYEHVDRYHTRWVSVRYRRNRATRRVYLARSSPPTNNARGRIERGVLGCVLHKQDPEKCPERYAKTSPRG